MPRRIRQVACNCCFIITVSLVAFMIPRHCFAQVSMPALRSINGKLKAADKSKRWKDVKRHSEELLRLTSENVIRRAALNDSDKKLVKLYHESGRYYLSVVVGQWAIDGLTARINGEEQKAEELFQDVLEMSRRLYGKQHKTFADALDYLGCTKRDLSKFDEAEPLLKQSLSIRTRLFGTSSTRVADSRVELAMLYARTAQYEDAVEQYTDAIETYRRHTPKESEKLAGSLNGLAGIRQAQGRYRDAERLYEDAIVIYRSQSSPDLGGPLFNLGNLCADLGRYEEADRYYREAEQITARTWGENHHVFANVINGRANLASQLGNADKAQELHLRALAIRQRVFGDEHDSVADSFNNLATLHYGSGNYASALPLYRKALKVFQLTWGSNHPRVAMVTSNLGNVYYRQGMYEDAHRSYEHALQIREKLFDPNHSQVADSLQLLARTCEHRKEFDKADRLYQRAEGIFRKVLGEKHKDVAGVLLDRGIMYRKQERFSLALQTMRESLGVFEQSLSVDHPEVATACNNIAGVCLKTQDFQSAADFAARSIEIRLKTSVPPSYLGVSYSTHAEAMWKLGQRGQALGDIEEAMRLAKVQRSQTAGAEQSHAQTFARYASPFETMVSWQQELGNSAAAFAAAEGSRTQSLQDQMALQGIDLLDGLPKNESARLRKQESDAKAQLASLERQLDVLDKRKDLSANERNELRRSLRGRLKPARQAMVDAYAQIRNASPAYRVALGENRRPVSLEKLQSRVAAADGLFLEYVLGTEGGYLFVIPAEGNARAVKLTINDSQAKALGTTAGPLTAERLTAVLVNEQKTGVLDLLKHPQRAKDATTKLAVLYELLIPETERQTLTDDKFKSLIVVSDGPLALLPFETLVVKGEADPTYLLDVGPPIHYAPSATVLDNLAKRNMSRSSRRSPVLTVADPAYDGSRNSKFSEADVSVLEQLTARSRYGTVGGRLQRLPYSATESRWVADVFGKNKLRVGQLLGSKATESQLRFNASDRHILHLACHGLVDQEYGNFFGALALTPGPNTGSDTANDGFLTLPEIYELNLQGCELAILSACDTNYGPHQQGEGVWALSRGFLVAGARRVVASNWLVDDEAAASLISYFCAGVAQKEGSGQTPNYSASLQAAKKWVRAQQKWSSPYYWGTFVLVGPE